LYVKENQWRRRERVLVAISVGVEVAGVRPSTPVFNRVSTQGLPGEVAAAISFTLVDEDEAMEGKPAMATTALGPATSALDVVVGLKAEGTEADVAMGAGTLDHGTNQHRCRGLSTQVARTPSHRRDPPQLRQSRKGGRHMLLQTRHHHRGQCTRLLRR